MSMLLMVKVMQAKVGNPLRKLVLIKLADNANDQGECWPSYQYIADQCEMSKRSVMAHIDALIESGFLRKELRIGGEKGNKSNVYTLRIPSAGDSLGVVQQIHYPSAGDSPPPSAGAAPRTSHYIEPVKEPNIIGKLDFSNWPQKPSDEVLIAWLTMRRRVKASNTQLAMNTIGNELKIAVAAGLSVDYCLSIAESSGWKGLKAEWICKNKQSKQRPMQVTSFQNQNYQDGDL